MAAVLDKEVGLRVAVASSDDISVNEHFGPTATDLLVRRGILPFMLRGPIEKALVTLEDSKRFISLKP